MIKSYISKHIIIKHDIKLLLSDKTYVKGEKKQG